VIYTKGQGFDGKLNKGGVEYRVDYFNTEETIGKIICVIENYTIVSNVCIKDDEEFRWKKIESDYMKIY